MSYDRRKVTLQCCDCTTGIDDFGNVRGHHVATVHCENKDGFMRCEMCGKIKASELDWRKVIPVMFFQE